MKPWFRAAWASLRFLVLATAVLGIAYTAWGLAAGQLLSGSGTGSLVYVDSQAVGSALLASTVEGDQWFYPRPTAADPAQGISAASNLGPNSQALLDLIAQRTAEVAAREGVDETAVPADAVTASASGFDPHISLAYAMLQVPRIAAAQGMTEAEVTQLVEQATVNNWWLAADTLVNVPALNSLLAAQQ